MSGIRRRGRNWANMARKSLGIQRTVKFQYPFLARQFRVAYPPLWEPFWGLVEAGDWESERLKIAYDHASGDVIDIGAWIGPYTLLMSGKAERVFSFEPDPLARSQLSTNIKLNRMKNVKVLDTAVSDSGGDAELHFGKLGSSMSSLVKKDTKSVAVKTTTLDEACEQYSIRPKFIKVDVEGAEGLVVAGAERTVARYRPTFLIEYHRRFMTAEEAEKNWQIISKNTSNIEKIDSKEEIYTYLIRYS